MSDRYTVWIHRWLLAILAGNEDVQNELKDEFDRSDICWSCLAREAVIVASHALYDLYAGDREAAARWVEHVLQAELDEHE